MRLIRHSGLAGAQGLTGCVVVLDVIRASNTVLGALDSGAREVWLAAGLDQARALKAAHPDWELWGERQGVKVPGFEGDNSPAQARRRELGGRTVVLTTSNGARAAAKLTRARPVFMGSLANAAALVDAIKQQAPAGVTLLAVGRRDNSPAPEDELVAGHLESLLDARRSDPVEVERAIMASDSAAELRRLGQHDDLALCARADLSRMVPIIEPGEPARVRRWRAGAQPFTRSGYAQN